MSRANQASSVFWLVLGLAVAYGAYRMGLGELTHPGPGFLFFWCGVILAGLSVLVFAGATLAGRKEEQGGLARLWAGAKWRKGVCVVLALLIYNFTFSFLGFSLSTMILLVFLFKAIETQKWSVAVGGAVVASLFCFLVFARWLDVQLPRGIIEKILF